MQNITSILKQEIAQLARKDLCCDANGYWKESPGERSELAVLKQRMAMLEQQVDRLSGTQRKKAGN